MTHAWLELLQEVERIAKTKFGGNSWSAWSEGTPKQMSLINALLDFKGHIIVTMRTETNWTTTTNDKGKVVPVRVGEAPKQGKGIEYEFDMLMQISPEHDALVIKDRTGKFQDECITKPDEEFGKELMNWLNDGDKVISKTLMDYANEISVIESVEDLNTFYKKNKSIMNDDIVQLLSQRKEKLIELEETYGS